MTDYLFVYGTLRKDIMGSQHALLADQARFYSMGSLCGKLYDLGGYPAAVESYDSHDQVFGEVYVLPDPEPLLAKLDDYEECSAGFPEPHEYRRTQRVIKLGGGFVWAWVYLYQRDVSGLDAIVSGNYGSYDRQRQDFA